MTESMFATAAFWYSHFQIALSERRFEDAEELFGRYQYWKRRIELDKYLSELCRQKEFDKR